MRTLAPYLGILLVAGCTAWHRVEVTPAEFLRDNQPDVVRVTRSDSSHINLRAPALHGDTIVGLTGQGTTRGISHTQAVPLADVTTLEVTRFSASKSAWFAVLVTGWVTAMTCNRGDGFIC